MADTCIMLFKFKFLKNLVSLMFIRIYKTLAGNLIDKICQLYLSCFEKLPPLPPVENPLLLDSALGLARKIRTRQVSCTYVIKAYIKRIRDVQPTINAFVDERFSDALEEACHVDNLILSGEKSETELKEETPFLGVPLSVKEAIGVSGMSFTTGVVSRKGIKAAEDATVVSLLRKAGAIPIVVTNTSEQCFWMEAYNNLYGRTNNPYNPRKTPGGSSGGEGAIIAAAGSVIGIGNDIGGSIRMPAFYNGVFGHKPSAGIVSNNGHFPQTEDVLQSYIGTGPICRYASDLTPMLEVMAGGNTSLLHLHQKVDISNLKVYYMMDDGIGSCMTTLSSEVRQMFLKVIQHFRVICQVPPQQVKVNHMSHGFKMWAYSLSPVVVNIPHIGDRIFGYRSLLKALVELVKNLFGFSVYSFPIIATVIVDEILGPTALSQASPYIKIKECMEKDFKELLQDDCVFLLPTMPEAAPFHYANLFRAQNCGGVAAFNTLGLPATHCPIQLSKEGLPIGVQVIAGMQNDHLNFAVARELEKAFGGWVCPGPIV